MGSLIHVVLHDRRSDTRESLATTAEPIEMPFLSDELVVPRETRFRWGPEGALSEDILRHTHGLGGQHQDVDRTPRERVSQNDRGQR